MRSLLWLLSSAVAAWKQPATIGKQGCGGRVPTKPCYRNRQWDEGHQSQRKGELVPVIWESCRRCPRGHIFCLSFAATASQPQAPALLSRCDWCEPTDSLCVFSTEKGEYRRTSFSDHQSPALQWSALGTIIHDSPSKIHAVTFTTWPVSDIPSSCTPVPHVDEGKWHYKCKHNWKNKWKIKTWSAGKSNNNRCVSIHQL